MYKILILVLIFFTFNISAQNTIENSEQELFRIQLELQQLKEELKASENRQKELQSILEGKLTGIRQAEDSRIHERIDDYIFFASAFLGFILLIITLILGILAWIGRRLVFQFLENRANNILEEFMKPEWLQSQVKEHIEAPLNEILDLQQGEIKKVANEILIDTRVKLRSMLRKAQEDASAIQADRKQVKKSIADLEKMMTKLSVSEYKNIYPPMKQKVLGEYVESLKNVKEPRDFQANELFWLAVYALQSGSNREALDLIHQAIDLDDKMYHFYSVRGNANYNLKNYSEALEDLDHAIELNSLDKELDPELWNLRAKIREEMGDEDFGFDMGKANEIELMKSINEGKKTK